MLMQKQILKKSNVFDLLAPLAQRFKI